MWRLLWFTAPTDQSIRKSMVESLRHDIGCIWSCSIVLKLLHISIQTTIQTLVCVFKLKRFDYSMHWDGYSARAFHRVQGPLKHLVWGFCILVHTLIAIDMSTEPEVCFVAELSIDEVRNLFNLVWTTGSSQNVFHVRLCEFMLDLDSVWVQLKILLWDSLQRCMWKTRFLGTFSERLFRTSSGRISHRIHSIGTSCSQLPARSGIFYLLIEVVYWPCDLKFVYPTINLTFLGIIVKLPAKFCLHSFE